MPGKQKGFQVAQPVRGVKVLAIPADGHGTGDLTISLQRHCLLWFAEFGPRCCVVLLNGQLALTVDDATRERMVAEYFERYIGP